MRLQDSLMLFEYVSSLLGGEHQQLASALKGCDPGRRGDGQSNFYSTFEQRASRLRLASTPDDSLDKLRGYDRNILAYEAAIGSQRPSFHFTYFQYLAALYGEIYLDRLSSDRVRLLLDLESYRRDHLSSLPQYEPRDLHKIALWMATGSGKTLLMHANVLQFLHYRPFEAQNILLLTPTETLTRQHLEELRLSGIQAHYALTAPPSVAGFSSDALRVQVLEITKLYTDTNGNGPRGGVSLPTSFFEGPNLLLVDEGHKGTRYKTDRETERAWRNIRHSLVENGGFTFEYSATFAQITESDESMREEYGRTILYEYAYARFHDDGYGKDFAVTNLEDKDELYGADLLLGGLLRFYQQRRLFDDRHSLADEYQIEIPLMVFVGAYVVSGGKDVVRILAFLDRVLRDSDWAINMIDDLLAGQSGLPGRDGQDAFTDAFNYLNTLDLSADDLYLDLCERLFRGRGRLHLHQLKRAEGEIGLRTADSATDAYCGVVNVGQPSKLATRVERETDVTVSSDDNLTDSLFETIDRTHSPVAFLIGSKKFIEGWSSWRVSVMCLLHVGKHAGAQVLQLFGRGIRLKGLDTCLRRSEALPGAHPSLLSILETLHIFGLEANYLETFLTTLDREGVPPPVLRTMQIAISEDQLNRAQLQTIETDPTYYFGQDQFFAFDPEAIHNITHDITPTVTVGTAGEAETVETPSVPAPLGAAVIESLPYENLFYHAVEHKLSKRWSNLYITREAIRAFFEHRARLAAPDNVIAPTQPDDWATLAHAARVLLEKGLNEFYYRKQRQAEMQHMRHVTVDSTYADFPRVRPEADSETETVPAYQLRVPRELVAEIDDLLADDSHLQDEALDEVLPRLHLDIHLYTPLLLRDRAKFQPNGKVVFKNADPKVSSTPAGLVESEVQFLVDLRAFWQGQHSLDAWQGYEIYLLRNLPKRGVGFFATAGFYPDFLLWLKNGDKQALAFIDPKGLTYTNWEKIKLLPEIRDMGSSIGMPLSGYITTLTDIDRIQLPDNVVPAHEKKKDWLESQGVLPQSRAAVKHILETMRDDIS